MLSGIIFLDKPKGWTSRDAVNAVIKLFGGKKAGIKAGHAGTLDPLATGMLPILLGEATRFANEGLEAEKVYEVTFDLTRQTDTLDIDGKVVATFDGTVSEAQLKPVVDGFLGRSMQVPPAYSAIHVDGKRAHELARAGEMVQLAPREVDIQQIELLSFEFPLVSLRVRCSKGSYIRALARDIGEKLNMGGCVVQLRRLSTGSWPSQLMVDMAYLDTHREQCVIPLGIWMRHLPRVNFDDKMAWRFLQGQRLSFKGDYEPGVHAVFCKDTLLGTGQLFIRDTDYSLHPLRLLPSAQEKFAKKEKA